MTKYNFSSHKLWPHKKLGFVQFIKSEGMVVEDTEIPIIYEQEYNKAIDSCSLSVELDEEKLAEVLYYKMEEINNSDDMITPFNMALARAIVKEFPNLVKEN